MSLSRWVTFIFTDPNSSKGLVIRAEIMEEEAEKLDGLSRDNYILYARALRELALKGWTPPQNKAFIRENLRGRNA